MAEAQLGEDWQCCKKEVSAPLCLPLQDCDGMDIRIETDDNERSISSKCKSTLFITMIPYLILMLFYS